MSSDFATTSPYALQSTARAPRPESAASAEEAPVFPTTPIYARKRKSAGLGGVSPAALVGGGVVLAALAGVVFALSWGGEPEPVEAPAVIARSAPPPAVNDPALMTPPAEDVAAATPAPAEAAPPVERAATPTPEPRRTERVARARPAPAAPSAEAAAEDASAMLPAGPMPYVPDAPAPVTSSSATSSPATSSPEASLPAPSAAAPPPVVAPPTVETPPAAEPADPVIPGSQTAPTP